MKRVFIIHGWDGYPEEGWFPWLKKELENKGFEVHIPQMPETSNPKIYTWLPKIADEVGKADEKTYFVGHSMGCQAIARYLGTLPEGVKVGGVIFVAGFFRRLTGDENDPNAQRIFNHWLESPIIFANVKKHILKSVAIFSDDDPYVPLDNQYEFKEELSSEIIIENNMKHFSGNSGTIKLPVVLKKLTEISSN